MKEPAIPFKGIAIGVFILLIAVNWVLGESIFDEHESYPPSLPENKG